MHLAITDSGLGGLAICAALEQAFRAGARGARLTYVNAWPEPGRGYNDLPDAAARARVFDRVLDRIAAMRPEAILIACNTLSIVYQDTRFRHGSGPAVQGIVESSLDLFHEALDASGDSGIVLIGTRTTIESSVHRDGLTARGVTPARIGAASCHGLATAIERDPGSPATSAAIATCAGRAAAAAPAGEPLLLGLACTHYGLVADRLAAALASRTGRTVVPLDPNGRMAADVLARTTPAGAGQTGEGAPSVEVLSKVPLTDDQRDAVARLLERTSPACAAALRHYRYEPDLF